jgi:hypothetical protein
VDGSYVRCGDKGCVRLGILAKLVKGKGAMLGKGMVARLGAEIMVGSDEGM